MNTVSNTKSNTKSNSKMEFDMLRVLTLINGDDTLREMVSKKFTGVPMMMTLYKNDTLTTEATEYIKGVFDKVILKRGEYATAYAKIKKAEAKVPRRYGKEKLAADIKAQGGRPTDLQRAMLALNNVRNIYQRLTRICIADMFNGTSNLSPEDCREIIAAVETLEKRTKKAVKK